MEGRAHSSWRLAVRILTLILGLLAFFVVDSMGLTYPVVHLMGDAMDWESHYFAGLRGINCGRVKIRGDAASATKCALQADAKGAPFRVIYDVQCFDSIVAGGIVRTPDGRILALAYDSCPSGCGFSLLQQRVRHTLCPQPYHLYVNPKGRINCFQQQLAVPHEIMSPNLEPY
jgi:hypothetical protein